MSAGEKMEPGEAFTQLGSIRLSETDLDGVLDKIAELAKRVIPGADEVSVTLVGRTTARTAAFTGELALTLDEWQYAAGYGPCLEASAGMTRLSVPEMVTENRWPQWASQAVRHGALSSLSIGLPVEDVVTGALNVYATTPHAFDEESIALAGTFADYAAVALANAQLYDRTATLAQQLSAAMDSRAVIEQAKGIVMGDRHCTADEAFTILVKVSQDSNRKLRDVAVLLVGQASAPQVRRHP